MVFVGKFRAMMQFSLATVGVSVAAVYWSPATFEYRIDHLTHLLVAYGATSAAFLAFPGRRRGDLCLWAVVALCAVEVTGELLGRAVQISDLFTDCLGVAAVLTPSWIEGLRRICRGGDWTVLSQRRRRSDRPSALRPVVGGLASPAG